MIPQGQGRVGPWWAKLDFMMGGSRWCQPYVVVHDIGGLVASCLCVGLVACVQGKTRLHEDVQQMLCARYWANGCWLNA